MTYPYKFYTLDDLDKTDILACFDAADESLLSAYRTLGDYPEVKKRLGRIIDQLNEFAGEIEDSFFQPDETYPANRD